VIDLKVDKVLVEIIGQYLFPITYICLKVKNTQQKDAFIRLVYQPVIVCEFDWG